ncbi:hypothetical protein HNQ94_000828 [Salirhabdus euzebyi]|uniref:MucB/RseB N-terminal domain-containing protein n=1 Tax=Salirhabdus euzebyi TaxID=394506 RepID=A0A841Q1U3_9BACI|nr:hypothetical protein [Salirhabdus euzebyi]MBB6452383.1 hypothetical protein [Salirhabdus euzebyi]
MSNGLDNLKEKMNETVLKDVRFEEKHMQNVFNELNTLQNPRKGKMTKIYYICLSTVVTSGILLGLVYFVGKESGLFSERNEPIENKANISPDSNTIENPVEPDKEDVIYTPPKQEEYKEKMTEEEILTKMLNTINNFETAQGSFTYRNTLQQYNVEYELSLTKNYGGYSKVVTTDLKEQSKNTHFTYYNDEFLWQINENIKTYKQSTSFKNVNPGARTISVESAFHTNSDGDNVTTFNSRPHIGNAQLSLFPYELASNYTRDYERWEIEKQNEEVVGHNTIVLKGTLDKYAATKHDSNTFRFWVDRDTGILVKFETYNANNEVVHYLYPNELNINVPINRTKFIPNLKGLLPDNIDPNILENNKDLLETVKQDIEKSFDEDFSTYKEIELGKVFEQESNYHELFKITEQVLRGQEVGDIIPILLLQDNHGMIIQKKKDGTNVIHYIEKSNREWVETKKVSKPGKIIE